MTPKALSVFTILAIVLATSGYSADSANVEKQIRDMEIARLEYDKDSSRWADSIADDALFMQGTGVMLSKQQTIEQYKNWIPVVNSTDLKDTEFRQSGDTAIFSYVTTRVRHDDGDRVVRHQHVRRTVVYQRKDGKWQLVFLSAAMVPVDK